MGGKWSKSSVVGWPTVRERMRRAEPAAKGGLEGLIHSQRRQDILDLWIYHTQGYFPD
nr:nef protein - human immunodeficiency virus type 1 [Human immunodeficiency virus 1]